MSLYKKSFKVIESESALRGFTTKHIIEGQAGYDPSTFFNEVKESVAFRIKPFNKRNAIFNMCHGKARYKDG